MTASTAIITGFALGLALGATLALADPAPGLETGRTASSVAASTVDE